MPGRPADIFGAAVAYANIAPAARAYDRALDEAKGLALPIRHFEAVLGLTYIAQIVPSWNLQPDVQYIAHPGETIANPHGSGLTRIPDAWVIGVTTQVIFIRLTDLITSCNLDACWRVRCLFILFSARDMTKSSAKSKTTTLVCKMFKPLGFL